MGPYYQYGEQIHTNRKDTILMPVYNGNEEMRKKNRYNGFTECGIPSWVKQPPNNQPIQNTPVPTSYTEYINPSNPPNPLQNPSTPLPTTMKQRGLNNIRYQPLQITQTSLTHQESLSWFCTQCNYPMICRIRLSPCYHLICISCFLQICTEKNNKCFCCFSDCSFAEALHHQDEVFTCSGLCYGYNEKMKGRSFLNQVSLKAHELFFHAGQSSECLANQQGEPVSAAPEKLKDVTHQYTESTCDPYSTSPAIPGELQSTNPTTYVPELPVGMIPFEQTENVPQVSVQTTFNSRQPSSRHTEGNKPMYHDNSTTNLDISSTHSNIPVRNDSSSNNYPNQRINYRNSNSQVTHGSMSGRHTQCAATSDSSNSELINQMTLSNIPYPNLHPNVQSSTPTGATQSYVPPPSSYDLSHNIPTSLNIDPPKNSFYMASEMMHPTNFKPISNQLKSNLSAVLSKANQPEDFEYLF